MDASSPVSLFGVTDHPGPTPTNRERSTAHFLPAAVPLSAVCVALFQLQVWCDPDAQSYIDFVYF